MWVCWRGHGHTESEFRLVSKHRRCYRVVPVAGVLVPDGYTCNGKLRLMTRAQEAAWLIGGEVAAAIAQASKDGTRAKAPRQHRRSR